MKLDPNTPGYGTPGTRVADNMRIAQLIKQGAKVDDFRPKKADPTDKDINPAYRREVTK